MVESRLWRTSDQSSNSPLALISFNETVGSKMPKNRNRTVQSFSSTGSCTGVEITFAYPTTAAAVMLW